MGDITIFNDVLAAALFGGNTALSGLFITIVFATMIVFLLASIKSDIPPSFLLVPYILISIFTSILGWIPVYIMAIIVIFCSVIMARSVSNIFSG